MDLKGGNSHALRGNAYESLFCELQCSIRYHVQNVVTSLKLFNEIFQEKV